MTLGDDINDFALNPPDAARVAARAIALSAVTCRAFIESDAHKPGAEELRLKIIAWIEVIGVAAEMELAETALLSTPLGSLEAKRALDATWQSEGMVVLAWALRHAKLPPVHIQCEPSEVANAMGFLEDAAATALYNPSLRDSAEIEKWADIYLTLHWRLRQFSLRPQPIDFVEYVSKCNWGPLRLDTLEIFDRDLAINGVRIDKIDYAIFRQSLSIVQERHRAFNWLLGFETVYSQVTADT